MQRIPEPEVMNADAEVKAYAGADFRAVNRRCARRALRAAGTRRGHALDLGTGPGDIPIALCRLAPLWRVTAVDLAPRMVAWARRNVRDAGLASRIRVVKADAKRAARLNGPFQLVFSNSLLHHLEDPAPFWRSVKRHLRPRTAVMIQDLSRPESKSAARKLVKLHAAGESPLLRRLFYESLLAAFTPSEVRVQLRAAGLENLVVRKINDRHLVVRRSSPRPRIKRHSA